MHTQDITPAQVELVKEQLPERCRDEGFIIKIFVAVKGRWKACVELIDGTERILEGTG